MAETKHSQENLAYIRTHVDNLERMVRFQISANPQSREIIRDRFENREGMAEVYLALREGPKTQDELMDCTGKSQPTVSRVLRDLFEAGMITKVPAPNKKKAYAWNDLELLLGVSRIAETFIAKHARKAKKKKDSKEPPTESSAEGPIDESAADD
jgi:DNA-binding transcriptional ArsR family regulator